jgi:hypothetical protein
MKYIKKVNEVWKGESQNFNRVDDDEITYYFFKSNDDIPIEYKVEIESVDDNYLIYHFKFFRKENNVWVTDELSKNTQKTNFKFLSLSTISNIFKDFFTDKKYDAIIYTSELVEKSMIKLYNSVSALIRNNYGGFFFNEDSKFVKYYVHYFNLDIKDYILTNYKTYIKI